jgi:hypothetical protein
MKQKRAHSGDCRLLHSCISLILFIIVQYYGINPSLHAAYIIAQSSRKENRSCEELRSEIQKYLQSDKKENIKKAAALSLQIPFDNSTCGGIHYSIVAYLIGHGIFPENYSGFIINTLYSIRHSSMDYRTTTCLHYIAADGLITDEEWNAGLHIVKSAKGISLPVYLKYVFINNERHKDEVIKGRIDAIITLASGHGIGDSIAVPVEDVIFSLIKGLENERTMEFSNTLHVLEKYRYLIPDSDEYNQKSIMVLRSAINRLMEVDSDRNTQTRIVKNIVEFLKDRNKSENPAHILIEIVYDIDRKIRHTRDPFYEALLNNINNVLADWFCFSLRSTNYINRLKQREQYIRKYRIRCRE